MLVFRGTWLAANTLNCDCCVVQLLLLAVLLVVLMLPVLLVAEFEELVFLIVLPVGSTRSVGDVSVNGEMAVGDLAVGDLAVGDLAAGDLGFCCRLLFGSRAGLLEPNDSNFLSIFVVGDQTL